MNVIPLFFFIPEVGREECSATIAIGPYGSKDFLLVRRWDEELMLVQPYVTASVSMLVINAPVLVTYLYGHAYPLTVVMMVRQQGEQRECRRHYSQQVFAQ